MNATEDRPLTARQRRVLDWITHYVREHGCGPTMREIAKGLGFGGPNGATNHVKALRQKGYLRPRTAHLARQLHPMPRPAGEVTVEADASGIRLVIGELVAAVLSVEEAAALAQQLLNALET